MTLFDAVFGPMFGGVLNTMGREGQRKAAALVYEVARRASGRMVLTAKGDVRVPNKLHWPAWEDMTQSQQETWMASLWEVLQEKGK